MLAVRAFWGSDVVTDATLRADTTFFESIFESSAPVSAERCAPVSDLRREICETAAQRVDRRSRRAGTVGATNSPPSADTR